MDGRSEFVDAVDRAYSRIKEAETIDPNLAFESVFSYDDVDPEGELAEQLDIGGDPTLNVEKIVRKSSDPIEDLGYARVVSRDEDDYGVDVIDEHFEDLNSPPSNPSWSKFGAVRNYFAMRNGQSMDPAAYAALIGIQEEPIAVYIRTAWGNGCRLKALLCTEGHIFVISNSNG